MTSGHQLTHHQVCQVSDMLLPKNTDTLALWPLTDTSDKQPLPETLAAAIFGIWHTSNISPMSPSVLQLALLEVPLNWSK